MSVTIQQGRARLLATNVSVLQYPSIRVFALGIGHVAEKDEGRTQVALVGPKVMCRGCRFRHPPSASESHDCRIILNFTDVHHLDKHSFL